MNFTETAPKVPLASFKRTKIIATVGPATDSYEKILELVKAGANGLRLNFSHGTHEERIQQIKWIRQASKVYGKPVAIIQDLQGPKIRLGDFDGVITLQKGQSLTFKHNCDYAKTGHVPMQYDLSKKVKRGERIYLYDGKILTTVTNVKDDIVHVRVENDGIIIKRKAMNLPDTDFKGDVITKKDREDLAFGSTQDIDYVAQSFVQRPEDIESMRKVLRNLGMNVKLILKFETKLAIENMEAIVQASDVIMVARGDLAVEAAAEAVPIVQRQLIGLCQRYGKPVIVATQMLMSMTESPEPSRAEVSDVATAVILGSDCVMLSDETANGQYPIEAVKTMKKIILYTEAHMPLTVKYPEYDDQSRQSAISKAVITLANDVHAKAIVAETNSGATALEIARHRPTIPLIAVSHFVRTVQQLALVYGVKGYVRPVDRHAATKLTDWLLKSKVLARGDVVVTASGRYPGVVGTTDTVKVRVLE